MVSVTLKHAGHEVVEASDGVDALEKAQRSANILLVITDANRLRMNGLDLVRKLHALPSFKFTPILTLTTEASPARKQEGKAAGATGWLVKPFNPETRTKAIQRVLH